MAPYSFREFCRSIRHRFALPVLLISLSGIGLSACGDSLFEDFDEGPRELPATPELLDGKVYTAPNSYVLGRNIAPHTEVRLAFNGSTITASAGCQRAKGPFTVRRGRLRAPDLKVSGKPCSRSTAEQEKWLVDFLRGPVRASVSSKEAAVLYLGLHGVQLEMGSIDLDKPDQGKLLSEGWKLDRFLYKAPGASSASQIPVPGASEYNKTIPGANDIPSFMMFDEDQFELFSGCGVVDGKATYDETTINLEPVSETTESCKGKAKSFHEKFAPLFDGTMNYRIDGPDLILTKDGSTIRFFSG